MDADTRRAWIFAGLAALFLLIIIVYAVSRSDGDLEGTAWRVDHLVVDGAETAPIDGTTITMTFAEGTVAGSGGCNNYQGNYEVDGDRLSFGPLAATERFCGDPPGTSDQEFVFFGLLATVDSFSIDDGRLLLIADGAMSMVLEAHDG